jgi:hypothetical protein
MTWDELVAFLDGARITGVTFEGFLSGVPATIRTWNR